MERIGIDIHDATGEILVGSKGQMIPFSSRRGLVRTKVCLHILLSIKYRADVAQVKDGENSEEDYYGHKSEIPMIGESGRKVKSKIGVSVDIDGWRL
jgi:hypothetical protein